MVVLKLKWNKQEFDLDVDDNESSVEVLKTQIWTLTNVPTDKQKLLGFPGGTLKDADDLREKVKRLKPGSKVQLVGTAEGGELKGPVEKVVFEEDLTPEEKARIYKEKAQEVLPVGLANLGNTCYMNSVIQALKAADDLVKEIEAFSPGTGDASGRDVDTMFTLNLKGVMQKLNQTTEAVTPMQLVMVLRQRFPQFAQMAQRGGYAQQDAEECLRGILTVLAATLKGAGGEGGAKNAVDQLFGFKMKSKLKCLESDDEALDEREEMQRTLTCHLGTQTEPVSHLHQGVQLSLKEVIEKNSPSLGRSAQYEKTAAMVTLPQYFVVQFARFGYKAASDSAGTDASKVKLVRKCQFSPNFDIYDYCSDELKKKLSEGRARKKDMEDAELEKQLAAQGGTEKKDEKAEEEEQAGGGGGITGGRSPKKAEAKKEEEPVKMDVDSDESKADESKANVQMEDVDTGRYELISIVSHKGRSADGGHYVGWARTKKADGKDLKDDRWVQFDDETVSAHYWKDLVGISIDLQGGKADTQIAYMCLFKRVPTFVPVKSGQAASAASGGEAAAAAPSGGYPPDGAGASAADRMTDAP